LLDEKYMRRKLPAARVFLILEAAADNSVREASDGERGDGTLLRFWHEVIINPRNVRSDDDEEYLLIIIFY
jgi:hypothetical protein